MGSIQQASHGQEEERLIREKAINIARGLGLPMAMKSAIELGVLDTLSEANDRGVYLSASEVASKIPGCVNPNAPDVVERMLSLLASFSVLKCEIRSKVKNGKVDGEGTEKVYGVEPVCKYFLANKVDGSMSPFLCLCYDKVIFDSWNHLSYAIKEGGIAFEKAQGMRLFEYAQKEKRLNKVFNDAMSHQTIMIMKKMIDVYIGFQEINTLVDVGGGIGTSLNLIISKYPTIKGISFDLPHVVNAATTKESGLELVGGDMFEEIPNGDAIILKWILHNWNDEQCVKILKNCWKALPKKGKVIVVEQVLPLAPENSIESQTTYTANLIMYLNFGATERTIQDYKSLAIQSGFQDCRVACSAHNNSIIEFLKA